MMTGYRLRQGAAAAIMAAITGSGMAATAALQYAGQAPPLAASPPSEIGRAPA